MSENSYFPFDVFLSHSSKDKPTVRELAERLREDGVRVWLDEWEIRVGDSIPAKIEEGLESSRVLVLCMSEDALASDWAALEAQTFRFRDPLNKQRRFIPLRLDDVATKGSVAQFLYVDWRGHDEGEYKKLVEVCRPVGGSVATVGPRSSSAAVEVAGASDAPARCRSLSLGHTAAVRSVAFSADGRLALSGSGDETVRVWEVETGRAVRVFEGHSASVLSVTFSPDGRLALSGSDDNTVRLWEVETGRALRVFRGHSNSVRSVAFSPDGRLALSGSADHKLRLWEVESGRPIRVFEGHSGDVWNVTFSHDGRLALSGSADRTIRLWDVGSGGTLRVLEGHLERVSSVVFSADGRLALSGSNDYTARVWEVKSGRPVRVFKGHSRAVSIVAFSADARLALSGSYDNTARVWDVESGRPVRVLKGHSGAFSNVAFSADWRLALSDSFHEEALRLWDLETGSTLRVFEGHSTSILNVTFSADGRLALSGSADKTLRLWEVESGRPIRVFKGHSGGVLSMAFSANGRLAVSGALDHEPRVWDLESGRTVRVLKGHSDGVWSVAFSADGRLALSGSSDKTIRVWEVETGRPVRVFAGHSATVVSVALSPDGRLALSGSSDKTVRVWEVETGRPVRVLAGHSASVLSVALSPDGRLALSGSNDNTVRLWELETGRPVRVLEGHSDGVLSVAFSADGRLALSGAADNAVRIWEMETGRLVGALEGHSDSVLSVALSPDGRRVFSAAANGVLRVWDAEARYTNEKEDYTRYTNAKVLVVGDSGVGKTGISMRLAWDRWEPTDSTTGAWATQMKLPAAPGKRDGVEREIWLWDFGGQADQRLIHQLYMEDTALAVLVFDGQSDNLFESLSQWERDIIRGSRKQFPKLLAAGRVDAGGLRTKSRAAMEKFARERGFGSKPIETSAKTAEGCEELKEAIVDGIDWDSIAARTTPRLFKLLKDEILKLKDEGRALMRINDLRTALELRLVGQNVTVHDGDVRAVAGLLKGPGVVWELGFGEWFLLQPELINAYAQAVLQTLRSDEHERGMIAEDRVLNGDLVFPPSLKRLAADEERILLLAMHATLLEHGLCLREKLGKAGWVLVFPSFFRRERPELTGHPALLANYRFQGFLDEVYASLVVRLHHTDAFDHDALWRYAADFHSITGKKLGVKLTSLSEGAGELAVYCDPTLSDSEKMMFSRFVHDHLLQKARDVERLRWYTCPHCHAPVKDTETAARRLREWLEQPARRRAKPTILCVNCEKRVPLWDEIEKMFASDETREDARLLALQSQEKLDSESKDRALVGEVISTVALAGQISRELNVSDHGIDMEIEFKDDGGAATGGKLYLQLKSGGSHLRARKRDGAEIFAIEKERHGNYWMNQAFPVMLVIKNAEGEIRWMEIREWLRRESEGKRKRVRQIVFEGERFDVISVRRWREKVLHNA